MSRISSILKLSPEQNAAVDVCVRRFRYVDLQGMLAELETQGIGLAKSTLHRYVVKLRDRDGMHAGSADDVVVVIVERSTGQTTTLTTGASRAAVVAVIEGLKIRSADFPSVQ